MISSFYINLDKDTDRKEKMEAQLERLGFSYERILGIKGKDGVSKEDYDESFSIKENGKPLTYGEIGCALSHRRAYEIIVERNLPVALILEDDAVLPESFNKIIAKEVARNHNRWEMLSFEYLPVGYIFIRNWLIASFKETKANPFFVIYVLLKFPFVLLLSLYEVVQSFIGKVMPGSHVFMRPLYHASCYLLTLDGAKKLLTLSYPVRFSADRIPNQARVQARLRMRGYVPRIVKQDKSFATNIV